MYHLAIDGACSGNPGPGGWAAILIAPNGIEVCRPTGSIPYTTNNAMEIAALIGGLSYVPRGAEVEVFTDSALVIGWFEQGWKRNDPALLPLLAQADGLIANRIVRFTDVTGHSGHGLNIEASALAQAMARRASGEAATSATEPAAHQEAPGPATPVSTIIPLMLSEDDAYTLVGLLAPYGRSPVATRVRETLVSLLRLHRL